MEKIEEGRNKKTRVQQLFTTRVPCNGIKHQLMSLMQIQYHRLAHEYHMYLEKRRTKTDATR